MAGAFSPMPPVKTIASAPFMRARYAPTYFFTRAQNNSMASAARRSLCSFSSDSRSRMSCVSPDTPRRPDCLLSMDSSSPTSSPSLWCSNSSTDASTSPARVPMTSPSSGVSPMDVSNDSPFTIAHAEHPLPRWSVMSFVSSRARPVSLRHR